MKNRKKTRVSARSRSSKATRAKRVRPTLKFARKLAKKGMKKAIKRTTRAARPVLKRKLKLPANRISGRKQRTIASQKGYFKHYEALLNNADIRQTFITVAGENAIMIIREFRGQMSDDELAMKTKIKVSEVRAVLNKLHSFGLVEYVRHRDKDSGWYSYVWKINSEKAHTLISSLNDGESATCLPGEHYHCQSCGAADLFHFDKAYDLSFKCPSCGNGLSYFEKKNEQ